MQQALHNNLDGGSLAHHQVAAFSTILPVPYLLGREAGGCRAMSNRGMYKIEQWFMLEPTFYHIPSITYCTLLSNALLLPTAGHF